MKKIAFLFLIIALSVNIFAQEVNIIQKPLSVQVFKTNKNLILSAKTKIFIHNDSLKNSSDFLTSYLQKYYKLDIQNNIFYNSGGGYAVLYAYDTISGRPQMISDYNNLYSSGTSSLHCSI